MQHSSSHNYARAGTETGSGNGARTRGGGGFKFKPFAVLVVVVLIAVNNADVISSFQHQPLFFQHQPFQKQQRHYLNLNLNLNTPVSSASISAARSTKLFLLRPKENNDPSASMMSFTDDDNNDDITTTTTATATATTAATSLSSTNNNLEQALKEAQELKARAKKERLEAERLSIQLTLDKIESLENELEKLGNLKDLVFPSLLAVDTADTADTADTIQTETEIDTDTAKQKDMEDMEVKKVAKKRKEIMTQIEYLKKQMELATASTSSTSSTSSGVKSMDESSASFTSTIAPITTTFTTATNKAKKEREESYKELNIEPMSKEVYEKRVQSFKLLPKEIKELYSKAIGATEADTIDDIIEKIYIQGQREKEQNAGLDDDDNNKKKTEGKKKVSALDMANAQAGYSTLPPPIQEMICESVGLTNEGNVTLVVEKLIEANKVKTTGDFGGVEFAMGDPDEEEARGTDREFTTKEIEEAVGLFDNLPLPMKTMLAASVEVEDSSNSTAVIDKMMKEKKILPSKDGVEFVVFGNENDELLQNSAEMIEGDNYVRSMLPDAARRDGNMPSEKVMDVFFKEILSKKTFNPISKPEPIPGGYIIRGDNKMKSSDALVAALEVALENSSIAGEVQPFLIRDPTLVTQEMFQSNTYELPVLMVTGTDLSPKTNRFVKPLVSTIGSLAIVSFSVAVCLGMDDIINDPETLEQMVSPLMISIFMTQVAHEAAHQVVAFKDKFKTGAPTIVPSIQTGLTGCITPLLTPPPNFKSLFDFAISGPLVGIFVSLSLMYLGLEQQVFMDTAAQSQLPSLPVELLRSSALAGGLVEWLLGDGVLLSPDPTALIRLHPFAIAGFVGLVSNALSLLPIGNTDGGRISLSLFGRSVSRVVRSATIGLIVIGTFFGDDTVNILLFYTIFAQIWQREPEIPCKNEIETVDDVRAGVALTTGLLVALCVIPMM